MHADGSASIRKLQVDSLPVVHEWSETRLKEKQRFVGLGLKERYVIYSSSVETVLTSPIVEHTPAHPTVLSASPSSRRMIRNLRPRLQAFPCDCANGVFRGMDVLLHMVGTRWSCRCGTQKERSLSMETRQHRPILQSLKSESATRSCYTENFGELRMSVLFCVTWFTRCSRPSASKRSPRPPPTSPQYRTHLFATVTISCSSAPPRWHSSRGLASIRHSRRPKTCRGLEGCSYDSHQHGREGSS